MRRTGRTFGAGAARRSNYPEAGARGVKERESLALTECPPDSPDEPFDRGNAVPAARLVTGRALPSSTSCVAPIKGFVANQGNGRFYFTDGFNIFTAGPHDVADVRTGFIIGRWLCSVAHFKQFCQVFEVAPEEVDRAIEKLREGGTRHGQD